ncbi:hypothetical protein [Devosia sp. SL43]|uniref:hypothetical protein n=1 Tax=Devosia sp. SL43 TaxID=2806348 RepID=UPI001F3FB9EF|nr:hypothetical protein [Devosia sp. SL43]UJW85191.1 hypothetical protein IM737_17580 [Devosia sp. SL43]
MALVMALALGACTTVEGTNAMTDVGTFEREVMNTTAAGLGLIPGQAPKEDLTQARAPLVLPASGQALPPPTQVAAAAQLPANSDTVQLDTSSLTEADIQRLRNAKVVDLRSLSGRPLTEAEARALTARMQAANMSVSVNTDRPLYLPPEEYFTRVGDAELVCAVGNGEVVSINDPKCPEAVRRALRAQNTTTPTSSGPIGSAPSSMGVGGSNGILGN